MPDTTIKLFGASDDLIEVEGQVNGCDEYGLSNGVVVFEPSGDRFRVQYGGTGRAVWEVTHEHKSDQLKVEIVKAPDDDDPEPYTDIATITGPIERVRVWRKWPVTVREIRERLEARLEDGLSDDEVRRVWEALGSP